MADGAGWLHQMYQSTPTEDLEAGRHALDGEVWVGTAVPKLYAKARGASFWDQDGREYIDCTSQAWSLNVGRCHPKVMAPSRNSSTISRTCAPASRPCRAWCSPKCWQSSPRAT